jgi:hypothetical protein
MRLCSVLGPRSSGSIGPSLVYHSLVGRRAPPTFVWRWSPPDLPHAQRSTACASSQQLLSEEWRPAQWAAGVSSSSVCSAFGTDPAWQQESGPTKAHSDPAKAQPAAACTLCQPGAGSTWLTHAKMAWHTWNLFYCWQPAVGNHPTAGLDSFCPEAGPPAGCLRIQPYLVLVIRNVLNV